MNISSIINRVYEWQCRKRIKNRNFSILSSNCIGGIIYHRLGMNFLTPTINMYIRQYDFIKFIKRPQYYVEQELCFIKDEEVNYPVARINDITLWFNHSKTEEDAAYDWNKRKKRIVWDNLYIIMYDRDNLTREDILSLSSVSCKRLIVLTEKKDFIDIEYVHYIKRSKKHRENDQVFLDFDQFGLRTFEKQFDFVAWLNGE